MKRALPALALLCSALVLAAQTPPTALIEGTVVAAAGQSQPLARAQVILTRVGGGLRDTLSAITDESGRFTIRDIPEASWRLFVEHERYLRAEYGQRLPDKPGMPITLASGQNLKLVVPMTAAGAIHGRVVNEYGEPLRDASVKAWTPRYEDGKRTLSPLKAVSTNDLGEFRIFGLNPGSYYVSAERARAPQVSGGLLISNSPLAPATSVVPPSSFATGIDLAVYYPNTNERGAAPIEVRPGAGAETGNLIIRHLASGVHVRGTVSVSGTIPIPPDIRIEVWRLGGQVRMGEVPIHQLTVMLAPGTDSSTFDFSEFAPGAYTLEATVGKTREEIQQGKVDIEVGETGLTNVDIRLLPYFKNVSGKVVVDGRPPSNNDPDLANFRVFFPDAGSSTTRIQPNGSFVLPVFAGGTYKGSRLTLMDLGKNWFVKSVTLDGNDILQNEFFLSTKPHDPIEIVISPNGGMLDGIVLDEGRTPLQSATVVLVPNEPRRARFDLYRTATSDAAGRAHIEGIPPGNYRLFAWDNVIANQWQDPEFMKAHEARGVAMTFQEGGKLQAEVKVIAGGGQ